MPRSFLESLDNCRRRTLRRPTLPGDRAMDRLTLAQAQRIIAAALEHSAASGYKPMSIVVLDDSGCLKAACREDGATMFRVDIATAKAWAAVSMSASSRALMLRAKET